MSREDDTVKPQEHLEEKKKDNIKMTNRLLGHEAAETPKMCFKCDYHCTCLGFGKNTWIFMIPATVVVEGEMVNFHSDLQRPFLWRQE